jgi:transcriptional regulator with XRE-family HTH domain
MVIHYRFSDDSHTGLSVKRYGKVYLTLMERVWIPALRRLMAAKSWKQQDLADASGVRPNTISDLLNATDPRIETLAALAKALDVPLWALFCTAHEHALFTERLRQDDASVTASKQREDLRALVQSEMEPLMEALVSKLSTGQPVGHSAKPLATKPTLAHTRAQAKGRKAGR